MQVVVREHDPADDLSQAAVAWINETAGLCPECRRGALAEGPAGGISLNVRCQSCGAEFNLHLSPARMAPIVLGGHSLDRDDPSLYGDALLNRRWTIGA